MRQPGERNAVTSGWPSSGGAGRALERLVYLVGLAGLDPPYGL